LRRLFNWRALCVDRELAALGSAFLDISNGHNRAALFTEAVLLGVSGRCRFCTAPASPGGDIFHRIALAENKSTDSSQ
jgi:hypothetical protein